MKRPGQNLKKAPMKVGPLPMSWCIRSYGSRLPGLILYFHYPRGKMGKEGFWEFTRDLFGQEALNYDILERVILKYLPGVREDIGLWFKTTEYPARFHLKKQ